MEFWPKNSKKGERVGIGGGCVGSGGRSTQKNQVSIKLELWPRNKKCDGVTYSFL